MKNYSKYALALGLYLTGGCFLRHSTKEQKPIIEEKTPIVEIQKNTPKNKVRDYIRLQGYILPKNLISKMRKLVSMEIEKSPEYSQKYQIAKDSAPYVSNTPACGASKCPEIWGIILKNADINQNKKIERSELEKLLSK